jgi:hypothetical protein
VVDPSAAVSRVLAGGSDGTVSVVIVVDMVSAPESWCGISPPPTHTTNGLV